MNQIELDIMRGLVSILNEASDKYYNTGNPIMTDAQFDARLSDLKQLEEEMGFIFANSPTQNVGYKVLTELNEVTHSHPMLSLEKCHTVEELIKFANNKELVASIKLDGLTCSLTYKDGVLVRAETRGNGHVGSDITEHVKQFLNVPLKISQTDTYIIDGEAIITNEDFAEINKNDEYKNSRNLAAGTLSVLDTSLVAKRKLRFYAWDVIEGGGNNLKDNLNRARELGFDVVPSWVATKLDPKTLQGVIDYVFEFAKDEELPCDGVVFKFNNIEYGKSLGATSHHFRNGIAYKAKDEEAETVLKDIEWSCGKSGILTPVAIFEPVELEGTTVERASLHNVSVMYDLYPRSWHSGLTVYVKKCNQIIPQISKVEHKVNCIAKRLDPPHKCPVCGGATEIKQDNDSKVLVCTNDNCKGKLLGKLSHFVSKNAMNIDGLSESTLEKFIELGWLTKFIDIYYLDVNKEEMMRLDGFGEKSVRKLLDAVAKSKTTTLNRFIYALSIPDVGRSTAKTIAAQFEGFNEFITRATSFDWEELDGIGYQTAVKINKFIQDHIEEIRELANELEFEEDEIITSNNLSGLTFVITGSLNHFANRDEATAKIEAAGGKVSGTVSAKTSYLVNNDVTSTSGKNKKALELGVKIINEEELIKMINQ